MNALKKGLVLTRKLNEQITIGDEIVLTVVRLSGDRVRIHVSAPRELRILRTELERVSSPDAGNGSPVG